jgi:hypothetical protein
VRCSRNPTLHLLTAERLYAVSLWRAGGGARPVGSTVRYGVGTSGRCVLEDLTPSGVGRYVHVPPTELYSRSA